ncbi:hypothetical protein HN011_011462 [Eciton burchellii]|nr:hypothetical protein HN011_011462 [Eciton burchellii]
MRLSDRVTLEVSHSAISVGLGQVCEPIGMSERVERQLGELLSGTDRKVNDEARIPSITMLRPLRSNLCNLDNGKQSIYSIFNRALLPGFHLRRDKDNAYRCLRNLNSPTADSDIRMSAVAGIISGVDVNDIKIPDNRSSLKVSIKMNPFIIRELHLRPLGS